MPLHACVLILFYSPHQLITMAGDSLAIGFIFAAAAGGALLLAVIFVPLFCLARYLSKLFGYPMCSGSAELCTVCCPYCYCAGVHLRPDNTGFIKIIACCECCYSVCGCTRPPLGLLTTRDIRWIGFPVYLYCGEQIKNRLGICCHSDVIRVLMNSQAQLVNATQPQRVLTTQPRGMFTTQPGDMA